MNIMNVAVAAGVAGLGYLGYKKFKKPTANDYQTMNVVTPTGVPIKVATPVSYDVTVAQATATPQTPPTTGTPAPVPTTVPGVGVTYAPPNTIAVTPGGEVHQPAPIVITPGGSSSIAIGSVKDVQHALNTLGLKPPLAEDGKLGPNTVNAIKAFQSQHKLVVDGNAGPATKAALSAALTGLAGSGSAIGAAVQKSQPQTGTVVTPTGQSIDTSAALKMTNKDVQHSLNVLGTKPALVEDGNLGAKSVAAIKSFQTGHGLTPDGVAGPKTKTALYLATKQAGH
jgi:peptidoglycan hydrolase-like protein with peptidoglycan-binding domain